jgi:peptide/nickel transport system ATP-binding protein
MAEKLLEIKDLYINYKTYNGTLKVLNGINLYVEKGEKIGLVGETGCGKTTILKSVLRVLDENSRIEKGKISYRNEDLLKLKQNALSRIRTKEISMIFQDPSAALNPVYTVGQQMDYILKYSGVKKRKEKMIDALKLVKLPDPERMCESYPFQLSGGMRQRVCIAMALAVEKNLLMADEPTTNLDVTIQDQILKLIKNLSEKRDLSLVLVTHSLGVAREITDRVYVMYAGNIVETGNSKTFFESPKHPYTVGLLESLPKLTGEKMAEGIKGRLPNYLKPPEGCRFNQRCENAMDVCFKKKPGVYKIGDNHLVSCFLYEKVKNL